MERGGFEPRFVLDCYPYPRQRAVPCCRSFPAVSVSLQVSRLSGPPFPAVGNGFIRSAITAARLSVLPEVCSYRPACIRRRLTSASCDTPVSRGVSGGCQSPIIRQEKRKRGNLELCGSRERSVAGAPHLNEAARGQKPLPAAAGKITGGSAPGAWPFAAPSTESSAGSAGKRRGAECHRSHMPLPA